MSNKIDNIPEQMADLLSSIANPVRLLVLCKLQQERKNVSQLLENLDISQSALSQHLILLKNKNIIMDEKEGKYVYYSIKDDKVKNILGFLSTLCDKNS